MLTPLSLTSLIDVSFLLSTGNELASPFAHSSSEKQESRGTFLFGLGGGVVVIYTSFIGNREWKYLSVPFEELICLNYCFLEYSGGKFSCFDFYA